MISEKLKLDTEFFGQTTVILGKRGSGKSYTSRVIIEEGVELGVPFIVIDPQAAYGNLPNFEYIDARKVQRVSELGELLAVSNRNIVIQTKGMTIENQQIFVKKLLESYRTHAKERGIRCIVIDEAHKFAPEYDKTVSKEEVRSMSQENRSDGLGFIAVEQRSQRLDKTVISQADHMIIHRMTSFRDLKAVEAYLDDPKKEIPIIKELETGQGYFNGFAAEGMIVKVRKAKTTHTGESPKNLLTEDKGIFDKHIQKVYKGKTMETVDTKNEPVKKAVPSLRGFMDLAAAGAKMSFGMGAAAFVGAAASKIPPIPVIGNYISNRTIAAGATTIGMYIAYRNIKNEMLKDIAFYAAAGAAIGTVGSLVFDVFRAVKFNPPGVVSFAVNAMTGASPVFVEAAPKKAANSGDNSDVDLNTQFA